MKKSVALGLAVALCVGCGAGSPVSPPPRAAQPTTTAVPAPTAAASSADATGPSIVHYDDLGVIFAVPPGFHVLGDDQLSARIRASANPHLVTELKERIRAGTGIPLLALTRGTTDADGLSVTLSVVAVPDDATAADLMERQQAVMKESLTSFSVAAPAQEQNVDGVGGFELSTRYVLAKERHVRSRLRLFVRRGVATLVTAVWPDADGRDEEIARVLDGLHFLEPRP
ncbi:MAG TPA: hypothetical protein VKU41_26435 [Polyangiaceae bacterium]|nr:hypothetical protein [Polyangiaceae bacterium]